MAPQRPAADDPSDGNPHHHLDALAHLRPGVGGGPGTRLREVVADLGDRWPRSPGRVAVGALAVVAVVVGAWWLLKPAPAPLESSLPVASSGGASTTVGAPGGPVGPSGPGVASSTTAPAELVVQAAGAVAAPGVYRVAPGARVDDLVRSAGGLTAEADGDRVNLAAPLADGERVWVPRLGEEAPPDVVAGTGGGSTGGGTAAGSGSGGEAVTPEVVDLNTADAAALDTLPGVGPATAQAILAYRDEHGPFAAVDDLLEVRGIGEAKLEQLRPLVRVG